MRTLNRGESLHKRKFCQAAKEVAEKRGDGMFSIGEVRALMNGDHEHQDTTEELNKNKLSELSEALINASLAATVEID